MGRLQPGENAKIDHINELVCLARGGNREAMDELLRAFHPMILSICKKWSMYFHDDKHTLKPFDVLVGDAQYWFMEYTLHKYIVDGRATYNNFIKNHVNQRIRYIYECEIKYARQNIFPDPDKRATHNGEDAGDMFDDVVYNYSEVDDTPLIDDVIDTEDSDTRNKAYHLILSSVNDLRYFNDRERRIFNECILGGKTQELMGTELGISRTRVTQIVNKIKDRIFNILDDNIEEWWKVR